MKKNINEKSKIDKINNKSKVLSNKKNTVEQKTKVNKFKKVLLEINKKSNIILKKIKMFLEKFNFIENIKKTNLKSTIMILVLIMVSMLYIHCNHRNNKISSDINKSTKNLMIVAHPDDETIFGGSHLINDKYVVVCVTCGVKKSRVKEFKKVMNISEDDYIMLDYPDKVHGKRSKWKKEYSNIEKDIKNIIESNDWNVIITHNPDGEYGHIHHKMISKIVTKYANNNKLYYFGHYYTKKELKKQKLIEIDNNNYKIKTKKMIEEYKTQTFVKNEFGHMFKYENWVKYKDWN